MSSRGCEVLKERPPETRRTTFIWWQAAEPNICQPEPCGDEGSEDGEGRRRESGRGQKEKWRKRKHKTETRQKKEVLVWKERETHTFSAGRFCTINYVLKRARHMRSLVYVLATFIFLSIPLLSCLLNFLFYSLNVLFQRVDMEKVYLKVWDNMYANVVTEQLTNTAETERAWQRAAGWGFIIQYHLIIIPDNDKHVCQAVTWL